MGLIYRLACKMGHYGTHLAMNLYPWDSYAEVNVRQLFMLAMNPAIPTGKLTGGWNAAMDASAALKCGG